MTTATHTWKKYAPRELADFEDTLLKMADAALKRVNSVRLRATVMEALGLPEIARAEERVANAMDALADEYIAEVNKIRAFQIEQAEFADEARRDFRAAGMEL